MKIKSKKITAVLLILLISVCTCAGCGKNRINETEKSEDKTEKSTEKESDAKKEEASTDEYGELWEHCTVVTDGIGIVAERLKRGKQVRVAEEKGAYYLISINGVELYVEKCFIRMDYLDAPEQYTGYGRGDAGIFSDIYMQGEPVAGIMLNTEINVLDTFGIWHYVECNGVKGYIYQKYVARRPDQGYLDEFEEDNSHDGGEIPIGAFLKRDESGLPLHSYNVYDTGVTFLSGKATVLADNIEANSGFLIAGDTLVAKRGEETCTIIYHSSMAEIPTWGLLFDGKTVASRTVTLKEGANIFDNYHYIGEPIVLPDKTKVELIFEGSAFSVIKHRERIYYLDNSYIE